jgi:hypothetical protein
MKESASIDLTGRSAPLQVGKEALLLKSRSHDIASTFAALI